MLKSAFAKEYAAFRRTLVGERKAKAVTQVELARRVGRGVTQSDVSKIERGERKLNVVEFIFFMRALGCDPAEAIAKVEHAFRKQRRGTKDR